MENKTNIVSREAVLRSATLEDRTAEFVISTEAVDRHGTVFKVDGWDLSQYNNNPVVFYAHNRGGDPDYLLGTGEAFIEGKQLIGRVTFEDADLNPLAEKILKKINAGTLRMASIGADPTSAHWGIKEAGEDPDVLYFDRQYLVEFSIVPIGSNPEALKREAQAIEDIKTRLIKEIPVTDPETVTETETKIKRADKKQKLRNAQTLIYKY